MRSSMQQLASYSVVFFLSFSSYPSEVRCSLGVRGLLDQLIDPLKVVGHRLTGVDVRHLQSVRLVCLSVCLLKMEQLEMKEKQLTTCYIYLD